MKRHFALIAVTLLALSQSACHGLPYWWQQPSPTPTAKPAAAEMKDKAAGDKTDNQMMAGQENKGEAVCAVLRR